MRKASDLIYDKEVIRQILKYFVSVCNVLRFCKAQSTPKKGFQESKQQ